MASKKALLGGQQVKVENFSGFDKSRFNAFTAPLGAIVPMVKQLLIPGSFDLKIAVSASLPPLATDAFLRSHLKVEAFFCPLRLCYGGFQSWFSGEKVAKLSSPQASLLQAKLPRLKVFGARADSGGVNHPSQASRVKDVFGPHTLMDYFGVKYQLSNGVPLVPFSDPQISGYKNYGYFNIFPFIVYQRICDSWYRNKLVERPFFCSPVHAVGMQTDRAGFLPFISFDTIHDTIVDLTDLSENSTSYLLNGHLLALRYRNYGFDYFTTGLTSAQDGNPLEVDTSSGKFTISALRIANAGQHFSEINEFAGPDYRQVIKARYGITPSDVVVQKPVLLGSADFPMFTSGVEQTAQGAGSGSTGNPFAGIAARYGRAHAEGSDFVCKGQVDEPGYLMVMCSLVPEANYAIGIDHDMKIFTEEGSIADLPCSLLERTGMEPIYTRELSTDDSHEPTQQVFAYQPRFMWHKAGQVNEVHGLFRQGASLESFIPQRLSSGNSVFSTLNTSFLKVAPDDLDKITAVSAKLSEFGVMVDSKIDLFVSEPLGESVLPSLVDPAYEHGRDVYLRRGGVGI